MLPRGGGGVFKEGIKKFDVIKNPSFRTRAGI
jgi:hypothetical protein